MKEYICIESPNEVEGGMLVRKQKLIRCKDCRYWGQDGYREGCKYAVNIMTEDDFCSRAEPKVTE